MVHAIMALCAMILSSRHESLVRCMVDSFAASDTAIMNAAFKTPHRCSIGVKRTQSL
jgi:hypothetical protein